MAKIVYATADYDDSLPVFKAAIIIHLENTQVLLLSIESKANDPEFAVLREGSRILDVKTDGGSIYWADGPRLTFGEIIDMLRREGGESG